MSTGSRTARAPSLPPRAFLRACAPLWIVLLVTTTSPRADDIADYEDAMHHVGGVSVENDNLRCPEWKRVTDSPGST
jgi:hypothetical protein